MSQSDFIHYPSLNFSSRNGQSVDMLVMHYTATSNTKQALDILTDPNRVEGRVSCHYVIDQKGEIYRLVPEELVAFHAGKSNWRGKENVNNRSIGIELVNDGQSPFSKKQVHALAKLSREIIERHKIPSWNVVAHSDIAPNRKIDPGTAFDWKYLAQQGVGIFPEYKGKLASGFETLATGASGEAVLSMQRALGQFGYGIKPTGQFDAPTETFVKAFQLHFRPTQVTGTWDAECAGMLTGLLSKAPAATVPSPDGWMVAG